MVSSLFSDGSSSPGFTSLTNCLISDGDLHGVEQIGGILNMSTCDVEGSAGVGVRGLRGAQLTLNAVTSSADNASLGLFLSLGSVAVVDSDTEPTGVSGDAQVGNNSAISWADFRANGSNPGYLALDGSGLREGILPQVSGAARYSPVQIAAAQSPYSVASGDVFINANAVAGAITVNLPTAAAGQGREITIKKIDAGVNVVTVEADGAETIDGAANVPLAAQWDVVTVVSDGSAWFIKSSVIA